jgi:hypothetical protein
MRAPSSQALIHATNFCLFASTTLLSSLPHHNSSLSQTLKTTQPPGLPDITWVPSRRRRITSSGFVTACVTLTCTLCTHTADAVSAYDSIQLSPHFRDRCMHPNGWRKRDRPSTRPHLPEVPLTQNHINITGIGAHVATDSKS